MNSEIFELKIHVKECHIDARNHVNNLVYLEWCLEAAEAHWNNKTTTAIQNNYLWYVISHHIDYKASAFLDENLSVTTWVKKADGVRSERHYKIVRNSDNKTLVEAHSIWCFLDAETLKPTKISEKIKNLFM